MARYINKTIRISTYITTLAVVAVFGFLGINKKGQSEYTIKEASADVPYSQGTYYGQGTYYSQGGYGGGGDDGDDADDSDDGDACSH